MHKLIGIIDEDPFNYLTWSGSSKYFFESLQANHSLAAAISAEPTTVIQKLTQIRSFYPNMTKWKFAYHLNTDLFDSMTKVAKQKIKELDIEYDTTLQVGAWYDLTSSDKINVSYHDGNLATRLASPFGYPKISSSRVNKALDYEKKLYARLDLIFPMSHWLGQSFVKHFGANENKVIPVGAGINLPTILDTSNRTYEKKRLLMVGKNFSRKGGDCLLEAFKKVRKSVPDAELRIIGPTLTDVPDGVKCLGFLSKNNSVELQKILQEYAQASVFVVPSLYEPFGISFAEAMAHRVPCIGTNICAMPEIIQDGETGFVVPPNDSEKLADRLIELLKSEELCKTMGEAGYKRYQENYTWEIVASKMLAAIDNFK